MEHSKTVVFPKEKDDEDFLEIDMLEFNQDQTHETVESESKNDYLKYINHDHITRSKWGRADEHTIQTYIKKSIGYKVLYNKTYFMYSTRYKLILWPLVCFTCFSLLMQSVFSTLIISDVDCKTGGIFTIVTAFITGLIAIFTYLETSTDYKDQRKDCRKAGRAFSEFADELDRLLKTPRERRANPDIVIGLVQADYKKLIKQYSTDIQIPASIYKKLIKKNQYKQILFDIVDNTEFDDFDSYDKNLQRSMIMDKFIDSMVKIKKEKNISGSAN